MDDTVGTQVLIEKFGIAAAIVVGFLGFSFQYFKVQQKREEKREERLYLLDEWTRTTLLSRLDANTMAMTSNGQAMLEMASAHRESLTLYKRLLPLIEQLADNQKSVRVGARD